jgi:hypothetical protein
MSHINSTGAVETKWEQHVKAAECLIAGIEVTLGQGIAVTQMQPSVHVGIGKGLEILWAGLVDLCLKDILSAPQVLCP